MRYVFWSGDAGIGIPRFDRDGGNVIAVEHNWKAALAAMGDDLRERYPGVKISALEINSHGEPARLFMTGGDIDWKNVAEFGSLLRHLMYRGARIELLACRVAAMGLESYGSAEPVSYSASVLEQYWAVVEKDEAYLDPMTMNVVRRTARLKPEQLGKRHKDFEEYKSKRPPIAKDGLNFCLTLARTSGAVVRAAWVTQWDENTDKAGPITRHFDGYGKWEGPVWDFLPSGDVKYLGFNLPRDKLVFPEHRVGPQVTNRRSGDGQVATGGFLRSRRSTRDATSA